MKWLPFFVLLSFYGNFVSAQIYSFENVPDYDEIPSEYTSLNHDQDRKVTLFARDIDPDLWKENIGIRMVLQYILSILTPEQWAHVQQKKVLFARNTMPKVYPEVTLSEEQLQSGVDFYLNLPDTLLYFERLLPLNEFVETLLLPEQRQVVLGQKQKDSIERREKYRIRSLANDHEYENKANWGVRRAAAYRKSYLPGIDQLHQELLSHVSHKDILMLDTLRNLYFSYLDKFRVDLLHNTKNDDGSIGAPLQFLYHQKNFEIIEMIPDLILFWSPVYRYFPYEEEQEHLPLTDGLHYLTQKYKMELEPILKKREKLRTQLKKDIQHAKTRKEIKKEKADAAMVSFTLVGTEEFIRVESVTDLWLYSSERATKAISIGRVLPKPANRQ
jgi:hypothetical protein